LKSSAGEGKAPGGRTAISISIPELTRSRTARWLGGGFVLPFDRWDPVGDRLKLFALSVCARKHTSLGRSLVVLIQNLKIRGPSLATTNETQELT
jgi:hypothetical protein